MSNLVVYSVTPEQRKLRLRAAVIKEIAQIPIAENSTTADHILYIKERFDKGLISEVVFRAVRDELTYKGRNVQSISQ